jgi:hypothetical protein
MTSARSACDPRCMRSRGRRSVAMLLLTCTTACGARTDPPHSPSAKPIAAAPEPPAEHQTRPAARPDARAETTADPEPSPHPGPTPPEEPPPSIAIEYPAPRAFPSGAVAATAGPVRDAQQYCDAYARTAPPPRRFNAHITVESECTVLRDPTSDDGLLPAEPLAALAPPYREVLLMRTRAPHDHDEGAEESWDGFEEIRVAIATEHGTFVEERGIELAHWLPASAVAIRRAAVRDVIAGGDPELRITLERFIGADEGELEQYQVIELVCGLGASGAFACARFASGVKPSEVPRSPVSERALRRIVLP